MAEERHEKIVESDRNLEPEDSEILVDGGDDGDVETEVSRLLLDESFAGRKAQNMGSDYITIPDLATCEADTDRSQGELSTLSKMMEKSGGICHENYKGKESDEGSMGTTTAEERLVRIVESEVQKQTRDKETTILKNNSEAFGLLLDRGKEGCGGHEVSGLLLDVANENYVRLEVSRLQLDGRTERNVGPEESRNLKRKQVEAISTVEAPRSKVLKLHSCTTRPLIHREKCVSEVSKEVKILQKSMGILTPISDICTTRAHTRSMERQRTNNQQHTLSMDQKKTSLESPKASRVRKPAFVNLKKPEMKESRIRKREQDENISIPDQPTTRKKRAV